MPGPSYVDPAYPQVVSFWKLFSPLKRALLSYNLLNLESFWIEMLRAGWILVSVGPWWLEFSSWPIIPSPLFVHPSPSQCQPSESWMNKEFRHHQETIWPALCWYVCYECWNDIYLLIYDLLTSTSSVRSKPSVYLYTYILQYDTTAYMIYWPPLPQHELRNLL